MKLSPFTLADASLDPGTVLLEASAGTGKTYALVGLVLRLLLERRVDRLDQILVVTFTVAATEELKNRLRAGLAAALAAVDGAHADPLFTALARRPGAGALLQQALDDFDQAAVATMHGFCKRLLEEAAFESHEPFTLDFTADPLPLLHLAAADAWRTQYEPDAGVRSALLHASGLDPDALVEQYRLWQRHPDVLLDPERPDLPSQLDALAAALSAAAAAFDDDAAARITQIQWLSGCPFARHVAAVPEQLRPRLHRSPALALGLLCDLAPSAGHHRKSEARRLDHAFFRACDAVASTCETATAHLRSELLHRMRDRLAAQQRERHVLSFDDLILRTHRALRDPARRQVLLPALRARYRVALLDEFQDTDTLQYEIFATCFQERPLFLVGDPKQSIYGFRGADLRTYLQARGDAVRGHTLTRNWRSSEAMVRAVAALFAGPHAFAHDAITLAEVHAAPRNAGRSVAGVPAEPWRWRFLRPAAAGLLDRTEAEDRIVADVAAEIARLLRGGATIDGRPVQPRDVAVLTRTNRQALVVQAALRAAAIPSAIGKAGDIWKTDELPELERFLMAVLRPRDAMRVRAAMATRWWGFDREALQRLAADDQAYEREVEHLLRWRTIWQRAGFVAMQEQVMVDLAVHRRFLSWQGGERRLTNLRQLFELLHDAEHHGRLTPEGLLEWLRRERVHQEEIDYTLRELRLESDGDAVQILTVHGSKGLEYEIVFCPFLWDGGRPRTNEVVPSPDGHELGLRLRKGQPATHRAQAERLREDLRLCYVAGTRARRRCYVHWGPIGSHQTGAWRSALAWLLAPAQPTPGDDATGWVDSFQDGCKQRQPEWEQDLAARCAASGGTMAIDVVPDAPEPMPLPPRERPPLPPARRAERRPTRRTLASFTSMVAGAVDLDPEPDLADRPAAAAPDEPARGMFAFARGPKAGQCLHHVLERLDWQQLAAPATEQLVRTALTSFALHDPAAHAGELDPVADVLRTLRALAAARVHPDGPTVAALCAGPRAVEWEFTLPTPRAEVQGLAALLAASPDALRQTQGQRLQRLPPQSLHGFLVGFVDLLAEHDGRHWVVDWKSNHLGNDAAAYAPAALGAVMVEHDYVLQYHLYVLALHRHLRARLPDYDYDRHVGGVCYAFLRGVVPDTASGMFHDRVPRDLVHALDRWAGGGHGGQP